MRLYGDLELCSFRIEGLIRHHTVHRFLPAKMVTRMQDRKMHRWCTSRVRAQSPVQLQARTMSVCHPTAEVRLHATCDPGHSSHNSITT